MKIGFLAIGNEILQGKIQDANGVWLARFLRPHGLQLALQVVSADDERSIKEALSYLYQTCSIVICSGGLGPTPDDVTKAALGEFFGKGPSLFSTLARAIAEGHYHRIGRIMPEGHGYGYLPSDFEALDNPSGLAPGLLYRGKNQLLLAAPGVPKEFRDLIAKHLPTILPQSSQEELVFLNFRTKGIPEEKIFNELCPGLWDKLTQYGSVSSLPHAYSVDVGVAIRGEKSKVAKSISEVRGLIASSPLAPHIWLEGSEGLEEVIIREAAAKKIRFAFAESCTGGLCSSRITNVSGSSQVFWGSVVSYDNSVKENLLGVSVEILRDYGAVSAECAQAMSKGARSNLAVDLAISLTGIAGPGGGTPTKPVGTVWIGTADHHGQESVKYEFKGDRESLKLRFSQVALFHLLDRIRAW